MGTQSGLMAMGEKHNFNLPNDIDPIVIDEAPEPTPFIDYSESEAAFAELRSFGDDLGKIETVDPIVASVPVVGLERAPTIIKNYILEEKGSVISSSSSLNTASCLMTAGEGFSGYLIESFLSPLSVWCAVSADAEDPLKAANELISERATKVGANGVVSVRWSFTPDGARILLTGTPVKCRKLD
ncbi:MAG: hypothetical protein NT000_12020 [Proteobacteria bacterium]|nr:hypothetical protein [Pseudomonadota bacterium]